MKDCPGVRSPCAICPTPTECLERTEKQVTEVSPQSTKLHNIEDILKKFITRETHQGSHARVVVQLAGILAERERAAYEEGKDAAYAAMANTASDALKEAAREAKQELKRKVLEVVPEIKLIGTMGSGVCENNHRAMKNEKYRCHLCSERRGYSEARSALIQFFDKEEGE